MALVATVLAGELISSIKNEYAGPQDSWPVSPYFYMDVIKKVVERDLEIIYSYTGVTSVGAPEAAMLAAEVSLPLCTESASPSVKAFVGSLTSANPSEFVKSIIRDCIGTVQLNTPGYTGTPVPTIYQLEVPPIDISTQSNMEGCWQVIASAIVDAIKTLTTTPIATTSPTGAGTSILNSVL